MGFARLAQRSESDQIAELPGHHLEGLGGLFVDLERTTPQSREPTRLTQSRHLWPDVIAARERKSASRRAHDVGLIFCRRKHIPDPAHSADRLGMGGVDLDLATQTGDAEIDRAIERVG